MTVESPSLAARSFDCLELRLLLPYCLRLELRAESAIRRKVDAPSACTVHRQKKVRNRVSPSHRPICQSLLPLQTLFYRPFSTPGASVNYIG